jgi:hypothetical protein
MSSIAHRLVHARYEVNQNLFGTFFLVEADHMLAKRFGCFKLVSGTASHREFLLCLLEQLQSSEVQMLQLPSASYISSSIWLHHQSAVLHP